MLKSGTEIAKLTKRNNTFIETATEQNCFKFERKNYEQADGLDIDVPTPSILIETYIQNMEHIQIHTLDYVPGAYSASNRIEYQESSWG
jgi:hypothetical protein